MKLRYSLLEHRFVRFYYQYWSLVLSTDGTFILSSCHGYVSVSLHIFFWYTIVLHYYEIVFLIPNSVSYTFRSLYLAGWYINWCSMDERTCFLCHWRYLGHYRYRCTMYFIVHNQSHEGIGSAMEYDTLLFDCVVSRINTSYIG